MMKYTLVSSSSLCASGTVVLERSQSRQDRTHQKDERDQQPDETPALSREDAVLFSKLLGIRAVRFPENEHVQDL